MSLSNDFYRYQSQAMNEKVPALPNTTALDALPVVNSPGREEEISFRQIEAFLAVIEHRSMTRAAQQMHVSQSRLSRIIASLETSMGRSLFTREARQLRPTPFAIAFVTQARKLYQSYVDTLTVLLQVDEKPLVLASCDLLLNDVVPQILANQATRRHSAHGLQILGLSSNEVMEQVASGRADAGLCLCGERRADLSYAPLLKVPVGLLASAAFRLPSTVRTLRELNQLAMVQLPEHMVLPSMLRAQGLALPAYFESDMVANSMGALCSAVHAGRHATLVSAIAAASPAASGLRFIALPHLIPPLQLCVVWRADCDRSDRDLVEKLSQCVQALSWPDGVELIESNDLSTG